MIHAVEACCVWTALHEAAFLGKPSAIDVLLSWGASVDCRDEVGDTPLHQAIENMQVVSVAELLNTRHLDDEEKKEMLIRPLNRQMLTPLHCVRAIGYEEKAVWIKLQLLEHLRNSSP